MEQLIPAQEAHIRADAVREARRISSEVEYIKNKLIDIKALGHKIDVYYAEAEPGSEA